MEKGLTIYNNVFEGCNVDMLVKNDGEVLFEIYSVGVAIGYYKKSGADYVQSGHKLYPRKERIDDTIVKANIKPIEIEGKFYMTEGDLYDFIFEAGTAKCKPFKKWVTHEVLPSIRKKGYYSVAPLQDERASLIMSIVDAPDDVTTALAVKNFENFVTAPLKEEIAELKPKSDYCDEVLSAENTFSASEVAAQLGIRSATALNKFLVSVEFIKAVYKKQFDKKTGKYKKVIAHYLLRADYVDKGLGDVVNVTSKSKDGSKTYSNLQLRYTTKGVKFIYDLIKEKAPELLGNKNNREAD